MMFILFDFIYFLFILIYLPYLLIKRKWHKDFLMRMGRFSDPLKVSLNQKKNIWIHAVSVGEVLAILNLIKKIKMAFPEHSIVCSTVTQTGYQLAQKNLANEAIVIYAPLDFSWIVRKYITLIHPSVYISTETEIWPNLYTMLEKYNVPLIQVNGRISDRAMKGYKKVKFLTKKVLSSVRIFCMQSKQDADRIIGLGASREKVRIVGNLKFDYQAPLQQRSKEDYGFDQDDLLFIAGSTHPGEERIIIDVYKKLIVKHGQLRLIIAPRHPERASEVIDLVHNAEFKPIRFSNIEKEHISQQSIVVVDTVGHLRLLYSLAEIVFIGKSLCVGGGQNVIEPACFGKPVIVGSRTENFKDVVNTFLDERAIVQVQNKEDLYKEIEKMLDNRSIINEIGLRAKQVVQQNQGATGRTMDAVTELLRP